MSKTSSYPIERIKKRAIQPKETIALCREYRKTKSPRVKQRIIEGNMLLVCSIAHRYTPNVSQEYYDYVHEGAIGLNRAVELFDPDRGRAFSTYATYWIWQAISYSIRENSRTIKIPPYISEAQGKIRKFVRLIKQQQPDRALSIAEIAEAVGLTPVVVRRALASGRDLVPLDGRFGANRSSIHMLVPCPKDTPEAVADRALTREYLEKHLGFVTPVDREILEANIGVHEPPKTMAKLSDGRNPSYARVRKNAGLRTLRRTMNRESIAW